MVCGSTAGEALLCTALLRKLGFACITVQYMGMGGSYICLIYIALRFYCVYDVCRTT